MNVGEHQRWMCGQNVRHNEHEATETWQRAIVCELKAPNNHEDRLIEEKVYKYMEMLFGWMFCPGCQCLTYYLPIPSLPHTLVCVSCHRDERHMCMAGQPRLYEGSHLSTCPLLPTLLQANNEDKETTRLDCLGGS